MRPWGEVAPEDIGNPRLRWNEMFRRGRGCFVVILYCIALMASWNSLIWVPIPVPKEG